MIWERSWASSASSSASKEILAMSSIRAGQRANCPVAEQGGRFETFGWGEHLRRPPHSNPCPPLGHACGTGSEHELKSFIPLHGPKGHGRGLRGAEPSHPVQQASNGVTST